jgi:CelD/BcsL family acetyltransferase involved in cellulose biosynthesis
MLSGAASRAGLPPSVPPRQQEKVRSAKRRAEKVGKISIESATWETLDEFLDAAFRWNRGGDKEKLLRRAAAGLLRADVLRMYGLRMDVELKAVYLGFICGERASCYLIAFDPAIAGLNPEVLMTAHAIAEAMREKAGCFDFLRGGEAHKYAWGAHDSHTYRRSIRRI